MHFEGVKCLGDFLFWFLEFANYVGVRVGKKAFLSSFLWHDRLTYV
jgi:hypothetical protein